MAGVERQQLFAADRVAEIKLVRADDVAFAADAEQLWLDGIEIVASVESVFLKTASSDSASRSRGPRRSAGVSFMPSGIQTLVTQVCRAPCRWPRRFRGSGCSARSRTGGCLCPDATA